MTSYAKPTTKKPFKTVKKPATKTVTKMAAKPATNVSATTLPKKSGNDIFAEADRTLTRTYVDKLAKAMGRK